MSADPGGTPTGPTELSNVGIVVNERDNVAVVKCPLTKGTCIAMPNGDKIVLQDDITPGHRFATALIPSGEFVRQYGEPIGKSRGVDPGDVIGPNNLENTIPRGVSIPDDLHNPMKPKLGRSGQKTWQGFRRADDRVGARNWIAVIPTSMCASTEALRISMMAELTFFNREQYPNVDGITALPHNKGCGCLDGSNINILLCTLAAYANHPNVGGVVFIDLGCEKTNLTLMEQWLNRNGGFSWNKPTKWISIQESGGTTPAIEKGLEAVAAMLPAVNTATRSPAYADEISLGVKCGGSDGFSGLSANPALGHCADQLIDSGGTVLITEVPEFCGAEHLFALRAKDASTAREILDTVEWYRDHAARFGGRLDENPSPGNIRGGLLNITIKSLGALCKAGLSRVEGVTGYAEAPSQPGLWLMQGPGYDQESTPGLVAAGAQVVVFTTGRGTTIGNAAAPVIKLASNTPIFEKMSRDIDLNAGTVLDGAESIQQVGDRVFDHVLKILSGEPCLAELNAHREFQVWGEESVSL